MRTENDTWDIKTSVGSTALFVAAAAAGVRQIVLLAAGLDSRGYRLPWPDGTVVFELDQPQVLQFKREVLARHGDAPTAERREVPVDLRNDWPQALRDNGFDPSKPSAWIAEGLLIYLPAAAQQQLFTGIDSLAAPGSHLALEESVPLAADAFEAKRKEEIAGGNDRTFFTLVYHEQHAPARDWFSSPGWWAADTPLPYQLRSVGRPVPAAATEAGFMTGNISLVSAIKD